MRTRSWGYCNVSSVCFFCCCVVAARCVCKNNTTTYLHRIARRHTITWNLGNHMLSPLGFRSITLRWRNVCNVFMYTDPTRCYQPHCIINLPMATFANTTLYLRVDNNTLQDQPIWRGICLEYSPQPQCNGKQALCLIPKIVLRLAFCIWMPSQKHHFWPLTLPL